jgi:hypothetical protein
MEKAYSFPHTVVPAEIKYMLRHMYVHY